MYSTTIERNSAREIYTDEAAKKHPLYLFYLLTARLCICVLDERVRARQREGVCIIQVSAAPLKNHRWVSFCLLTLLLFILLGCRRRRRCRLLILYVRATFSLFFSAFIFLAVGMPFVCTVQASVLIRQDICTLTHRMTNMNIAYLFMFSQFDFLLLYYSSLHIHIHVPHTIQCCTAAIRIKIQAAKIMCARKYIYI